VYILRPYPAALDVLRDITEPVQSTANYTIVHIAAVKWVVALTGMSQAIMVVIFVGALV
jgi:hypothetical protein